MSQTTERLRHTEHFRSEVCGIDVCDCSTPNALGTQHMDLIWVGCHMEGAWLTLEQARQLAAAITTAADRHAKRLVEKAPS